MGLVVGAAFLVAISGIVGMYVINESNKRNRETEVFLYQLAPNAQGLNSNEWEAIAGSKIDSDLQAMYGAGLRAKSRFPRA